MRAKMERQKTVQEIRKEESKRMDEVLTFRNRQVQDPNRTVERSRKASENTILRFGRDLRALT